MRLIQKIYDVDPIVCPKCQDVVRIASFIEDPSMIRESLAFDPQVRHEAAREMRGGPCAPEKPARSKE